MGIDFGHLAAGLQWQMTSKLAFGCVVQNIMPWYKRKVSNKSGEEIALEGIFKVPVNYTIGTQYLSPWGDISIDNQIISGNYGGKSDKHITFHLIRSGWEYPLTQDFFIRSGVIVPITLSTSTLGDLSLPSPGFNVSIGAGYKWHGVSFDAAIYGDPGKSYVEQRARIRSMLSIAVSF